MWTGSSALPDDSALVGRFPFALRRAAPLALAAFARRRGARLHALLDLRRQVVDVVVDQRHAFGVDARQQDAEHFGRQLDVVQRLDQLIGGEMTLLAVPPPARRRSRPATPRRGARSSFTATSTVIAANVVSSLVDGHRRLVVHSHHPSPVIPLSAPVA